MKKNILYTTLLLAAVLLVTGCSKDADSVEKSAYIWGESEKITVGIHPKVVTVIYQNEEQKKDIPALLGVKEKAIASITRVHSKIWRIDLKEKYRGNSPNAIPALTMNGSAPILMTGEISIMPTKDSDIDQLIEKYNLRLVDASNYGSYLLAVPDPSQTLTIANSIHETENVKYATPDFIGIVVPMSSFSLNQ